MKKSKHIENIKEIGDRIKEIRTKTLHLNQKEFAEMLGLNGHTVLLRYEKGEVEPPLAVLRDVARFGKTSIDWILNGEERGAKPPEKAQLCISEDSPQFEVVQMVNRIPVKHLKMAKDILKAMVEEENENEGKQKKASNGD